MKTPVEIEVKISVVSASAARARLRRLRFAVRAPRRLEQNILLDDAKGSLRAKGLLLRVRRIGRTVLCTCKGPEVEGRFKRREEREFVASNFEECMGLFEGIGYRQSFFYEKFRTEFLRPGESGHVTLDETPIGVFLEIEGAPRWIERTAIELAYGPETWITSSYAYLYSQWQAEMGGDPAAMRFPKRKKAT